MITCREEAERWVHRYAAGGAVFAAAPIPGTAPILAALETHLVSMIGNIYGESLNAPVTAAAGGTFAAMGTGLKAAAGWAVGLVPVVGPVIRASIAAAAIEAIGQAAIAYFERKYPGKVFTQSS